MARKKERTDELFKCNKWRIKNEPMNGLSEYMKEKKDRFTDIYIEIKSDYR